MEHNKIEDRYSLCPGCSITKRNVYCSQRCNTFWKYYGAIEQKAIDDDLLRESKKMVIDKACEWLKENVEGGVHPQSAYGFVDKFRKEMED